MERADKTVREASGNQSDWWDWFYPRLTKEFGSNQADCHSANVGLFGVHIKVIDYGCFA